MNLFNFDPSTILSFFLTLFRISLVLFLLPFFGGESLPKPVKAVVCIILTLGLWPALSFPARYFPAHPFNILIMILGELVLGLTMGLLVRFLFAAIQTGGELAGFQMGFSMINIMDPINGTSESVTAHFLYMTSLLTFLCLNGHLYLLKALAQSFELVPPGSLFISPQLVQNIITFSGQIFVLAIKIAAPIITAIFLVDLALALISRAAPQMNVLFVGFPIKICVGFLFLGLLFGVMNMEIANFIRNISIYFDSILRAMIP